MALFMSDIIAALIYVIKMYDLQVDFAVSVFPHSIRKEL